MGGSYLVFRFAVVILFLGFSPTSWILFLVFHCSAIETFFLWKAAHPVSRLKYHCSSISCSVLSNGLSIRQTENLAFWMDGPHLTALFWVLVVKANQCIFLTQIPWLLVMTLKLLEIDKSCCFGYLPLILVHITYCMLFNFHILYPVSELWLMTMFPFLPGQFVHVWIML